MERRIEALSYPSSNFGPRPDGSRIDTLVLHYTDTRTVNEALKLLTDQATEVSAHYVVDENGDVYALVAEEHRAWHAGLGSWRGKGDVNSRSIGIELQNPGARFGLTPFPDTQMKALLALCQQICASWPIEARNIIGHSDLAPDRKIDPGPLFDWQWLARNGIGFWPSEAPVKPSPLTPQEMLVEIGYDALAENAVAAFQLRFCPTRVDNKLDAVTTDLIARVLREVESL